jgi:hypothetical protein
MKHLSFLILLAFSLSTYAQNIYTIDGADLGDRDTFINQCVGEEELEIYSISGISITKRGYCTCMADQVVPLIPSADLLTALDTDMLLELISSPNYLPYFEACALNYNYTETFDYSDPDVGNDIAASMINLCIQEIRNDPSASLALSETQTFDYCSCLINSMIDQNIPFEQMSEVTDETHPLYNQVIMPCMNEALNKELVYDWYAQQGNNELGGYNPDDITGGGDSTVVNLTGEDFSMMPITIGSQQMTLPLSAYESYLVISSQLESQLLSTGWLSLEDDKGVIYVEDSYGNPVSGHTYLMHNIQVGEYLLQNVSILVRDDIPMTIGATLFSKFSDYYINDKNQFILYR